MMIISCENCGVRFNLDENLVKATGSRVRCSKCHNIFMAYKPAEAEEAVGGPGPEESGPEGPHVLPEAPSAVGESEAPEGQDPEISEGASDEPLDFDLFESEEDQDEEGFSLEDLGLGDDTSPEQEAKGIKETVAEEEIVPQEEITAHDVGFEQEQVVEEVSELTPEGPSEHELEGGVPDISLAEDQAAPSSVEQVVEEELQAEGGPSLDDLSLEEEPVADEAAQVTEQRAEDEISLEDLHLEEPSDMEESSEAWGAAGEEAEEKPEDMEVELPEAVPLASLEATEEVEETEEEPAPVPPPIARQQHRARKRMSMPLMVLLILCLVGGGAYGTYTVLESLNIKIPFLESLKGAATSQTADPGNMHASLLERDISGAFVSNNSAGRLFVIKGKLRNDYPEARNFIRVKGILYLRDGKVAQDRIVYCGNVLSDTDLHVLDKEAINKKLHNRFGENKSNYRVPSGRVVPFMVVFSDIPHEVGEFSVEVVDSLAG
jgi:predicted Zn finger-like uncharacterized protein